MVPPALLLEGPRRQVKDWEGMWNVLSHVLPPGGGGYRWGVSLGFPPILTSPHQGGRDINSLPVLLSASLSPMLLKGEGSDGEGISTCADVC